MGEREERRWGMGREKRMREIKMCGIKFWVTDDRVRMSYESRGFKVGGIARVKSGGSKKGLLLEMLWVIGSYSTF
jgi:hypothetical protein